MINDDVTDAGEDRGRGEREKWLKEGERELTIGSEGSKILLQDLFCTDMFQILDQYTALCIKK